jgi:hypothetical protein
MIGKYADERPPRTTAGFQEKLLITKRGSFDPPTSQPLLTVVIRPYARTFEARESAIFNALNYINDICGYHIGDLHFTELRI